MYQCPSMLILTSGSILDQFQLIILLSVGHIFLLFCMSGNLGLNGRHCGCTLLGTHFLKFLLIFLSFVLRCSYLKIIWILLSWFVRWVQSCAHCRINYSHWWGKIFLSAWLYPVPHELCFLVWLVGIGIVLSPVWALKTFSYNISETSFLNCR